MEIDYKQLMDKAKEASKMSYSPFSRFAVGAALIAKSGKIYSGCNVENSSFGMTNCAERTAFFKAVSEGVRSFSRIAIVGNYPGREGDYCAPCGVCRQVMAEFCDPETFQVILARSPEEYRVYLLKNLLPVGFGPSDLI